MQLRPMICPSNHHDGVLPVREVLEFKIIIKTVLKLMTRRGARLAQSARERGAMGRLTTHVLDTANGVPARGMRIDLARIDGERAVAVKTVVTNHDGRTDAPMLADGALAAGTYVLTFHVRDYFAGRAGRDDASPFLDQVPLRFVIADAGAHYHVPLLVSPWSYSTYRGS